MTETKDVPFYQELSLKLLALTLIAFTIYIGQDILVPLAFAILLAILLLPVASFLERKGFSRVMANLVAIFLGLSFIAAIVYFLSYQISTFVHDLPAIKQHLANHLVTVQQWVREKMNFTGKQQSDFMANAASKLKSTGSAMLGDTVVTVTQSLLVMVLLPVYTFLVLYYRDMIRKFLIQIFKDEHEPKVIEVLRESRAIVQGYMIGLIIEMGIVAAINSAGFFILGIRYAIFLGVLAAILNMIPYIGMLIASIICMLITLTSSTELTRHIWRIGNIDGGAIYRQQYYNAKGSKFQGKDQCAYYYPGCTGGWCPCWNLRHVPIHTSHCYFKGNLRQD
jgi:predicted PurR-regulated permease PerM